MRNVFIVDAKKFSPNVYGGIVRIDFYGKDVVLQFAISELDFIAIKRITEFRPFENTGVGLYSYRFTGTYSKSFEERAAYMRIEIKQNRMQKNHDFDCTDDLIARLLWFAQVSDFEEIQDLFIST